MNKVQKVFKSKLSDIPVEDAKDLFVESIALLEHLHQKLHELLHYVLESSGITDLTPVQAILIYNLGEHEIMAGELKTRGFYLGSNVSYNLKKLVNLGYISQEKPAHDKRSVRVSLTDKGHEVRKLMDKLYEGQIGKMMGDCPLEFEEIRNSARVMDVWNQFWTKELGGYFHP